MKNKSRQKQTKNAFAQGFVKWSLQIDKPEMPMGRQIALVAVVLVAAIPFFLIRPSMFNFIMFLFFSIPVLKYRSFYSTGYDDLRQEAINKGINIGGWEIKPDKGFPPKKPRK